MEIKLKGLWLEACAPSLIMKSNWKIEENEMETKLKGGLASRELYFYMTVRSPFFYCYE